MATLAAEIKRVTDNMAGLDARVALALFSGILTVPDPVSLYFETATNPEDIVTITDNFTMIPPTVFTLIEGTVDKENITSTLVGEVGSKSLENVGVLVVSGVTPEIFGNISGMINQEIILLFSDRNCNYVYMFGSNKVRCTLDTLEYVTGESAGDAKMLTIGFKFASRYLPATFDGKIDKDGLGDFQDNIPFVKFV